MPLQGASGAGLTRNSPVFATLRPATRVTACRCAAPVARSPGGLRPGPAPSSFLGTFCLFAPEGRLGIGPGTQGFSSTRERRRRRYPCSPDSEGTIP
jgi:hypothetical protein